MSILGGHFATVGALGAFPRRLALREVAAQGGQLTRSPTRNTKYVVFGRGALRQWDERQIEDRVQAVVQSGRQAISELTFLRMLDIAEAPYRDIGESALREKSKLSDRDLRMLTLFDLFEGGGPYTFRDVIVARKYSALLADGMTWINIARSFRDVGGPSLTSLSIRQHGGKVYAVRDGVLAELDGQQLLPLPISDDAELDDLFERAEEHEADGHYGEAARLYQQCLGIDPTDSIAAFNLANCLKAADNFSESAHAYSRALKLDPNFSEAWFNFADLLRANGKIDGARHHLRKALETDRNYADAIYNLAVLEYDAGRLAEARAWWKRYLQIDRKSEWASTAMRGIQVVDLELNARKA